VPQLNVAKPRSPIRNNNPPPSQQGQGQGQVQGQGQPLQRNGPSSTPIFAAFTSQSNSSTASLQNPQNFSRPTLSTAAAAAARSVAAMHSPTEQGGSGRNGSSSPLAFPSMPGSSTPRSNASPVTSTFLGGRGHARKHSQNAGMFDSTLPSTSTSNLSHLGLAQVSPPLSAQRELSASQIAAQAAVMHHQSQQQQQTQQQAQGHGNQQQQQQQQQQQHLLHHNRQRSQTVPFPGAEYEVPSALTQKRGSGGPLSPPMLSLTEASTPRESSFGKQSYHNGLLGNPTTAAATAANLVFPRSRDSSPALPSQAQMPSLPPQPPLPSSVPVTVLDKPTKSEKSKVKLFSRPGKIGTKGEPKEKALPSPSKIGHALSSLQRGNFSTTSLDSTAQSFYSLANSSSATIRPVDEKEGKEKEKRHNIFSRQKHKLRDKEDFHLPLSSASSNSKPTDPNAPSSLYSFNLPPSPGPNSTSFKAMSALELRHGARGLTSKKREDRADAGRENELSLQVSSEWPGPSSMTSAVGSTAYLNEIVDPTKYGLSSLSIDDAWPFLKAKLLAVFEGEDLRLPIEDFNRVVTMHIQYCIQRRSPNIIVEDVRDLLITGFGSLDYTLRRTPEDRLIPALVEMWVFAFTSLLPYMQAIFLPLDLEFSGNGPLMSRDQARDFWGGVVATSASSSATASMATPGPGVSVSPASSVLEVRRMVLLAYRDCVILPRYEILKSMFSRFSLEFLPRSLASAALASPPLVGPAAGHFGSLQPHSPMESHLAPLSGSPSTDINAAFTLASLGGLPPPRPGTAMSLDPSVSSYNSNGTTLLGDNGSGGGSVGTSGLRSRAISNVSFASSGGEHPSGASGGARPQPSQHQ
jgi:hypothetical protein